MSLRDVFFPKIEFTAAPVRGADTLQWLWRQGGSTTSSPQDSSGLSLHHISITLPSPAVLARSDAHLQSCQDAFPSSSPSLELLFQPRRPCLAETQTPQPPSPKGWDGYFYHFPILSPGFDSLCIHFQQHSDWILEVPALPWLLQVPMNVLDMTRCDTPDLCENNLSWTSVFGFPCQKKICPKIIISLNTSA